MKKISYFLSILVIGLTSCSKKDGSADLPHPEDPGTALDVPSSFGRKTLIEEVTGAWCGYCPAGTFFYDQLDSVYAGKMIGVSIHVRDIMEDLELTTIGGGNMLADMFPDPGVPRGVINRGSINNPVYWPSIVPSEVGLFPKCGFAIDATSVSGSTATITVHTGFSGNLYGDYRLNVFIVEASVHHATDPAYDQHNYYSQTGTSPEPNYPVYYNQPPIIVDFHHENVLRKLVTSIPYGDQIPQSEMVKGHDYIKTFTVDLGSLTPSACYVVAFVDKYGTTPDQHQVQNVQRVWIGKNQTWN